MGLDIGLEQAGFQTILSSEIDNACRKTILRNKPKIALIGDINKYNGDEIRKAAGLKGFDDERGNVFLSSKNKRIAATVCCYRECKRHFICTSETPTS